MANEVRGAGRLRGLYAITPRTEDTAGLLARASACMASGAAVLQYRPKDLRPGLALTQARELAQLCRAHGTTFIVNWPLNLKIAVDLLN